jgi:hypothetical protein
MNTAIKLFFSSIWTFLLPFLKVYLTEMGGIMANSAISAVKYAATMNGASGSDKRKIAVTMVMSDLKSHGFEAAKNVIYGAVVAAYEKEYGDTK